MLGFGEDTLLGWRVRRTGTAVYEPAALVEHEVFRTGLAEALSRSWMAGAFPALVREVPELRGTALFGRRCRSGADRAFLSMPPLSGSWVVLAGRRS